MAILLKLPSREKFPSVGTLIEITQTHGHVILMLDPLVDSEKDLDLWHLTYGYLLR